MAFQHVPLQLTGIDHSLPATQSPGALWMQNIRESNTRPGEYETTPRFSSSVLTAGTYWNGAAPVVESGYSLYGQVGIGTTEEYLTISSYTCRNSSTQLPCFFQSTTTTRTDTTGANLLRFSSYAAAISVNLGSSFDVEITSGTQFRWRKNGGAWSAAITITLPSNSVDAGNVSLYWLTNTGFNVGDTWTYLRTDRSQATQLTAPVKYVISQNSLFYIGNDNRLMRVIRTTGSTSYQYVITAGYSPTYGEYLYVYQDHLFLSQFRRHPDTQNNPRIYGNSDLTDLDNFFPTDLNEADVQQLPLSAKQFQTYYSRIVGFTAVRGVLQLWTSTELYESQYLGLPTVFNFTQTLTYGVETNSLIGNHKAEYVVESKQGAYLFKQEGIWFYDGASVYDLTRKFQPPTAFFSTSVSFVLFNETTEEVVVGLQDFSGNYYAYVYQERYQKSYIRTLPDFPTSASVLQGRLYFGASEALFTEQIGFGGTAVSGSFNDDVYVIFNLIGGQSYFVKELRGIYVGATCYTSGSPYWATSATQIKAYWKVLNGGNVDITKIGTTLSGFSTATNSYWSETNSDGLISFPNLPFRQVLLALLIKGTNTSKPVGDVRINAVEVGLHNATPQSVNPVTR